jgi:hypothetical protein
MKSVNVKSDLPALILRQEKYHRWGVGNMPTVGAENKQRRRGGELGRLAVLSLQC